MEWIPFDKETCPHGVSMLFLDNQDVWIKGALADESEYGLCIRTNGNYWSDLENFTHYFIPTLPSKK
jgi:hypothetical protein